MTSNLDNLKKFWEEQQVRMKLKAEGIDPIFGCETLGPSGSVFTGYIMGSWFTCPEKGLAESITVGLRTTIGEYSGEVKCASYKKVENFLVGETEERTLTLNATPTWYKFNFYPKPRLENADYYLEAWTNITNCALLYYAETAKGAEQHIEYNNFPDPWIPFSIDARFSIYCTYSPANPLTDKPLITPDMVKKAKIR